jgi:CBS domain-containing membrane protein
MTNLTVSDLMTGNVHRLGADASALEAYDLMTEKHFRHLPIVDDDDNLVGLVTERDLLRHALAQMTDLPLSEQRRYLERYNVGELMTAEPESVSPDDDLESAGRTLLEQKFGCLPVCEGTTLVGILTEADFVKYVIDKT